MTKHINIDELLAEHQLEEGELTYALKQSLYDLMLDTVQINQKGQFEDEAGNICWYLEDLLKAINDLFKGDKE